MDQIEVSNRLLLTQKPNLEIGDIVVYKIKGRDIPIVHRVLQLHRECVSLSLVSPTLW